MRPHMSDIYSCSVVGLCCGGRVGVILRWETCSTKQPFNLLCLCVLYYPNCVFLSALEAGAGADVISLQTAA